MKSIPVTSRRRLEKECPLAGENFIFIQISYEQICPNEAPIEENSEGHKGQEGHKQQKASLGLH